MEKSITINKLMLITLVFKVLMRVIRIENHENQRIEFHGNQTGQWTLDHVYSFAWN